MRGPQLATRWNSPQQLFDGYLNTMKVQRHQTSNSVSQPRVTKIGCTKFLNQSQDLQLKRIPKEVDKSDQTRKISILKNDLSDLRLKVTQMISTDKQFVSVHNGMATPTNESYYYVKQQRHTDGFETPTRQLYTTQTPTIQKKQSQPDCSTDSRIFEQMTNQKPRPELLEHQLREDLRQSAIRQRKLAEERDELARRLQARDREFDNVKQMSDRMRVQPQDKSIDIVVDGLRRQNADLQMFYKQKLEEADRDHKNMEVLLTGRNQEITNSKLEILNLQKTIKNQQNMQKSMEIMQQSNRKLEKQILQMNSRMKNQQLKVGNLEDRLQKFEQIKNILEGQKIRLQQESRKLQQEARKLRDVGKVATDELAKLKQKFDCTVRQKNRQIQVLIAQRDKLKQSSANAPTTPTSHSNNLLAPPLPPKQTQSPSRGKSQTSRSSIFIMSGSNSSQQLLEQSKRQQIERLNTKIDQLKKQKKSLQQQVKTLLQTKQAIELSIRNQPKKIKQVDELRGQLLLKQQTIGKMCQDLRAFQQMSQQHQKLGHRVRSSQNLLREANEQIMRRELLALNRKYN